MSSESKPTWKVPTVLTSLVGREKEVAAVHELLKQANIRLVTLLGAGGVGKTRLSLQVATVVRETFADGVCFVGLASISDPSLVIAAIAEAIGIREIGEQPYFIQMRLALQDKHLLLILDNFEQVVAAAPQIEGLLSNCSQLKILVTSRAVLHVQGEQEFPVSPLTLPSLKQLPDYKALSQFDAIALFIQRVRFVLPTFQITSANAHTIAEICIRLDGLPLAIELAAARIKLLPPQALLTRLSQRLNLLTSNASTIPARQQTLRNTLEWSYNLLNDNEQRLFRRLSIFVGGWTLEAAEALWNAGTEAEIEDLPTLDGLESLLDKSLLLQIEQEGAEPRLMMLETVREYGLECLSVKGEIGAIRLAHAEYYLAFAEKLEPELIGPQQVMWLQRLECEHDNLRAALQWLVEEKGDRDSIEMAMKLSVALQMFWLIHSHYSEGRYFLEKALVRSKEFQVPLRARVLEIAAILASNQGDQESAEILAKESLALNRELEDTKGIGKSLQGLGQIALLSSNFRTARPLLEEALELYKETRDNERIASVLFWLGYTIGQQGEYMKALALLEESIAISRKLQDKIGIAISLVELVQVLLLSQGDTKTVRSHLDESFALLTELGDNQTIANCIYFSGLIAFEQGDLLAAYSQMEESVLRYKALENRSGAAEALSVLARIKVQQDKYATAHDLYKESLTLTEAVGEKGLLAFNLEGWAGMLSLQGEVMLATRIWGAAEALREAIGAPIPPFWRLDYEQWISTARSNLGEEAFALAWTEGRAMPLEQTLAALRSEATPMPILGALGPVQATSTQLKSKLTSRELEVLRLLSQGLTNSQIAKQLVVSLPTINTHVASIFNKLDVTSRSAATRYAVEHHLV